MLLRRRLTWLLGAIAIALCIGIVVGHESLIVAWIERRAAHEPDYLDELLHRDSVGFEAAALDRLGESAGGQRRLFEAVLRELERIDADASRATFGAELALGCVLFGGELPAEDPHGTELEFHSRSGPDWSRDERRALASARVLRALHRLRAAEPEPVTLRPHPELVFVVVPRQEAVDLPFFHGAPARSRMITRSRSPFDDRAYGADAIYALGPRLSDYATRLRVNSRSANASFAERCAKALTTIERWIALRAELVAPGRR